MPIDETTEFLLSRGLDADLDRPEMRALYRAAAADPAVPRAMGRLAALEEGMLLADAPVRAATPRRHPESAPATWPTKDPGRRLWRWLRAPGGISLRPLSLAGGVAAAILLILAAPSGIERTGPADIRLNVHDLRLTAARTELEWTYQFILRPGQTTRVALDIGDTLPIQLQFEAPRAARLTLTHRAPDHDDMTVRDVTVSGIVHATLRDPRPGDVLDVANRGPLPVVVYAYTNGYGGSRISPGGRAL